MKHATHDTPAVLDYAPLRRVLIILALIAVMLTASGCASYYGVTFDSSPRGASLFCFGKHQGHTPMNMYYNQKSLQGQTLLKTDCMAIWASGSRYLYEPIPWQYYPAGLTVTAKRPNDPGLETDLEVARRMEQMQIQQQQQQAQWAVPSQPQTVSCTKIMDISGQVYQFKGSFCPPGYLKTF